MGWIAFWILRVKKQLSPYLSTALILTEKCPFM